MIEILLTLLVLLIVFAVAAWIVDMVFAGIPALAGQPRMIARAIVGLIFLIVLLGVVFGGVPVIPLFRHR